MDSFDFKKAVADSLRKGKGPASINSSNGAAGGSSFSSPFSVGRGRGRGFTDMPFGHEQPQSRKYQALLTEDEARDLALARSVGTAGSSSGASYHPHPYAPSYGQEVDLYGNHPVVSQSQALVPRNIAGKELVTVDQFVDVMRLYNQDVDKRLSRATGSLREELKGRLDSSLNEVKKDAAEAAALTAKRFDDNEGALKETATTLSASLVSTHNLIKDVAKEGRDNSMGLKQILDDHAGKLKATDDKFSVLGKRQADSETVLSQIRDLLQGNPGSARSPSPPPAPPAAATGRGRGGAGAKKKK